MNATIWKLRTRTLSLDPPVRMGIVNVTPDSFSDGGRFLEPSAAVEHALELVEAGAGILDLGAESTRPGSEGVAAHEELRRLLPVLTAIRETLPNVPISVDTVKAVVAEECLRAGAEIVNDVSSCADPDMPRVLRETGAGYCLMHCITNVHDREFFSGKIPATNGSGLTRRAEVPDRLGPRSKAQPRWAKAMQDDPRYENVVEEVYDFLRRRRDRLLAEGIERERIAVDPGLGFGKTVEHNWTLVDNMERFHALGAPLLVGPSRKRFIAAVYDDRDEGTRIVTRKLLEKGVQIVRLHEIDQ